MSRINRLERIAREYNLASCLECGKCTSSCPYMPSLGDPAKGKSPRHIVKGVLSGTEFLASGAIWFCPTCDVCTERCPSGIPLRRFFEALRREALESGHDEHCLRCSRCGTYLMPQGVHAFLVGLLGGSDAPHEFTHLCPRCRSLSVSRLIRDSLPHPTRIAR
jgi:heterodisulfide reductase subunit C